jgi:hypothetical protein
MEKKKFQGLPRIITSFSFYCYNCLKTTSIYYQECPWVNTDGGQGFLSLICRGCVYHLWLRFGRQDLVCVYSDDIIKDQVPDDPFHDRDSQYPSSDVFYHTPFSRQVSMIPTNHHSHFFLFQLLSQDNECLLSRSHTNSPFPFNSLGLCSPSLNSGLCS